MFVDHGGDLTYATQELKAIEEAESPSALVPSSNSKNLSDAFENLHVEDGTGLFTIHDSVILQMGAGDFSTHEFKRWDLIISEKPIFFVQTIEPGTPGVRDFPT